MSIAECAAYQKDQRLLPPSTASSDATRQWEARPATVPNHEAPYSYRYTYDIHGPGTPDNLDLLGGKANELAKLANVPGVNVPHGFVITTDGFHVAEREGFLTTPDPSKFPGELSTESRRRLVGLESQTGKRFGDNSGIPLIAAIRAGAKFSMPGVLYTVKDVGINDRNVEALARDIGLQGALDSYWVLVRDFGIQVFGLPRASFEAIREEAKAKHGVERFSQLPPEAIADSILKAKAIIKEAGHEFPQDPFEQYVMATNAVMRSWLTPKAHDLREFQEIPHDIGTAVLVQEMRFGNASSFPAGSMVVLTKNRDYGPPQIDRARGRQGSSVVSASSTIKPVGVVDLEPSLQKPLSNLLGTMNGIYNGEPRDLELTYEQRDEEATIYTLQSRHSKNLSALGRFMYAQADQQNEGAERTMRRVSPADLTAVQMHLPEFPPKEELRKQGLLLGHGQPITLDNHIHLRPVTTIAQANNHQKGELNNALLVRDVDVSELPDLSRSKRTRAVATTRGGAGSHSTRHLEDRAGEGRTVIIGTTWIKMPQPGDQVTIDPLQGLIMEGHIEGKRRGNGLPPDQKALAEKWLGIMLENPWAHALENITQDKLDESTRQAWDIVSEATSQKALEVLLYNLYVPEFLKIPFSVFQLTRDEQRNVLPENKDAILKRALEILRAQRPYQEEVSLRTAHTPQLGGRNPYAAPIKTEAELIRALTDLNYTQNYGGYPRWIKDHRLRAIIVGAFPKGNKDPELEKIHIDASLVVIPKTGVVHLEVRPGSQEVSRGKAGTATVKSSIVFDAKPDFTRPNGLGPAEVTIGEHFRENDYPLAQALHMKKIVYDHWKEIATAMAEITHLLPPFFNRPAVELKGRFDPNDPTNSWIKAYGLNADVPDRFETQAAAYFD